MSAQEGAVKMSRSVQCSGVWSLGRAPLSAVSNEQGVEVKETLKGSHNVGT